MTEVWPVTGEASPTAEPTAALSVPPVVEITTVRMLLVLVPSAPAARVSCPLLGVTTKSSGTTSVGEAIDDELSPNGVGVRLLLTALPPADWLLPEPPPPEPPGAPAVP